MLLWLLAACGSDWKAQTASWHVGQPVPDFPLVDEHGTALKLSAFTADWVLVGFVYTRCAMPEACPLTTSRMQQVQSAWKQAGRTDLHLLTITLDPAYDTPAILAAYAAEHHLDTSNWTLATGAPAVVSEALPSLFNVYALPSGPATFTHPVVLALLAPGLIPTRQWANGDVTSADVLAATEPRSAP